jgi:DNA modification methylase
MSHRLVQYVSNESLAEQFEKSYSTNQEPISVSFRTLFPDLNKERYTHLIHAYPAKLLTHIPYFFLNNSYFSKKGDTVLDPFCGTGTVLLEANIAGRNAIGADANPLARLIASVKTRQLDGGKLTVILKTLVHRSKLFRTAEYPNVVNRDFWFSPRIQFQLAKIRRAINELPADDYKAFFDVCFSNCVKKVSYADPHIAVPVKLNPDRFEKHSDRYEKIKRRLNDLETVDVLDKFKTICSENITRINKLSDISEGISSRVISENAQVLTASINSSILLEDGSVDMILTSPPYAGAQKYIRSSCLNLGWLGLTEEHDLKSLDRKNIGRENYLLEEIKEIETGIKSADKLLAKLFLQNRERAYIVGNYLQEIKIALDESIRVLKYGGYFVIVIGNNSVCDNEFNTQSYLTEYIESKGLKLQFKLIDDIKSYGLMTKRNKTADIISREWVLVFKKI